MTRHQIALRAAGGFLRQKASDLRYRAHLLEKLADALPAKMDHAADRGLWLIINGTV